MLLTQKVHGGRSIYYFYMHAIFICSNNHLNSMLGPPPHHIQGHGNAGKDPDGLVVEPWCDDSPSGTGTLHAWPAAGQYVPF